MYLSRMIEVGKAANGYIVSCSVPLKPDTKKTDKMSCCCIETSRDKQYIAEDAAEVAALIADIMPLLDGDYKTESDFDKAFDASTKDMKMDEMKEGE